MIITADTDIDVTEVLRICNNTEFKEAIEEMSAECMDYLQDQIGNYFTDPEEIYAVKDLTIWALDNGFKEDE